MRLTPIARRLYFAPLWRQAESWTGCVREVQLGVLAGILAKGARTAFGKGRALRVPETPDDARRCLAEAFPSPVDYSVYRSYVMRMIEGERDVLWPGTCRRFAQSSGTSDGKSKYIPITPDSLSRSHYRGAAMSVASYLNLHPDSRLFEGKAFILGGSYANELHLPPWVRVGDLSATLIDRMNPFASFMRVPSRKVALMPDWDTKLPALIASTALRDDITNISGVPSWFLTVLKGVLARTNASSIHHVWSRLEVFFHGGISMQPYYEQYSRLLPYGINYHENYNASEGFFAASDRTGDPAMRLMLDCGTFYEFIPLEDVGKDYPRMLAAWEVECGETYALVITSCNGLFRYPIGDTVRIADTDPLRITVEGRTKCFINAFGEELMVTNADAAIAAVCRSFDCLIADYTAAPVYAGDNTRGRHEWLIEFTKAPADLAEFARHLDLELQARNSDYQAKRSGGIFLDPPTVVAARPGLFDDWLAMTGKRGGQRKVPRLANDRRIMDECLRLNSR